MNSPVYLDCNATTPLEPEVWRLMQRFFETEYGNEGSRTHEFGARAKQAVQKARDQVAAVVGCQREEVIFTSGATEANNLALLGLAAEGERTGRRHIVSSAIEHKAVLEPLEALTQRGFKVTLISPDKDGKLSADKVADAVRSETLLVSVMHANNETGIIQPVEEVCHLLREHPAYIHVDAAQTFGKLISPLRSSRIDLISLSAHKTFGPKGIGALVTRRRGYERVPLTPLTFGGGQERGLRPGTLPVPLIVGLGLASELSLRDHEKRAKSCQRFGDRLRNALVPIGFKIHGDPKHCLPHVINLSFIGIDSEAAIVALKPYIAISNGSACTSATYRPSHVLEAMQMSPQDIEGAVRFSWCHLTPEVDWTGVVEAISSIKPNETKS